MDMRAHLSQHRKNLQNGYNCKCTWKSSALSREIKNQINVIT